MAIDIVSDIILFDFFKTYAVSISIFNEFKTYHLNIIIMSPWY